MHDERRSSERLRAHYEIEKQLAEQLKNSAPDERRKLYPQLYDELFRRVPDHPQQTRLTSAALQRRIIDDQLALLKPFLGRGKVYMEIGAGDCGLALAVASRVQQVIAIEVSQEIVSTERRYKNFELKLSDGVTLPVAPASIHIAYSNQLMEHLHPEDAVVQLRNVFDALAPGGCYLCVTPNAISGPHDISQFFSDSPRGFHLREYTVRELAGLFREAGFSRLSVINGSRGFYLKSPVWWLALLEMAASRLPSWLRRSGVCRAALGIRLAGYKARK